MSRKKVRFYRDLQLFSVITNGSPIMTRDNQNLATPPAEIVPLNDPDSGLSGVIVLHSTKLGPAAGGCRFWPYASDREATVDALRLAEGMSYKNALAGLPFGGGKAVIKHPNGKIDRPTLFRAFGRAVAQLGGRYITAEDVGTSVQDMQYVAETTKFVAGLPARQGMPGGDPSPWTALGTFRAMEVAVARHMGTGLNNLTVAVQGLGNVGYALCSLLHRSGARLIVAEPRSEIAARAATEFDAEIMSSRALLEAKADVFAPCALGGILDSASVMRLRAKVVCGAANNQLATPEQGLELAARDILYAPDYVVNAGGIINVAAEYFQWSEEAVQARVERIGSTLSAVLEHAREAGMAPNQAADSLARGIIDKQNRLSVAA
ncbi:amino acid dehydrogenase [Sphingomonas sp. MMSM24]|uniref:Amino acid dehydrogenase n=2 Tax=Sphingomonas lycopersici TaxID=2951807 RepID=A0AA41ZCS5_9SPHN|nr:amino acid dehydrogenase [Sphingomonas lycopersici]